MEVLARAHRQMKLPSPRPRKSELEAQVLMALDVEKDISRLQKRSTLCLGLQISVMILQEGPRKVRVETLGRSIPGRRSVSLSVLSPVSVLRIRVSVRPSVCFCPQIRAASSPQSDADVMSPFPTSAAAVGQGPFSPWASSESARAGPRCVHGREGKLRQRKSCEGNFEDNWCEKHHNFDSTLQSSLLNSQVLPV